MTMNPDPVRYPDSWRPKGAPEIDDPEPEPQVEPLAMEIAVSAMSDEEFERLVQRARPGRN
jgi:hypothetical protein